MLPNASVQDVPSHQPAHCLGSSSNTPSTTTPPESPFSHTPPTLSTLDNELSAFLVTRLLFLSRQRTLQHSLNVIALVLSPLPNREFHPNYVLIGYHLWNSYSQFHRDSLLPKSTRSTPTFRRYATSCSIGILRRSVYFVVHLYRRRIRVGMAVDMRGRMIEDSDSSNGRMAK